MITRRIVPGLPKGCQICGFLYEADAKEQLSQDMIDVVLPNGVLITGGWYPDRDPNGKYRVSVYHGYDEIIPPIESDGIGRAIQDIEECTASFVGRNLYLASDSGSTVKQVDMRTLQVS